MDKLKKVFSPGSSKDDEVLYGNPETRGTGSAANTTSTSTAAPTDTLHPIEGSNQKGNTILGQLTNPGGDKYDEQRYGTTATTDPSHPNIQQSSTDADRKGSISQQILNPGGDKYDEQRFGPPGQTAGTEVPSTVGANQQLHTAPEHKDKSILRQILNPGGDKYDEQAFGSTATATRAGTGNTTSGATNPSQTGYGSSNTTGGDSSLGRDAALAGGAGALGAGGAYAAHEHNRQGQSLGEREDVHRTGPVDGSSSGAVGSSTGNVGSSTTQSTLPDRSQPGVQRSEQQNQLDINPGASTTASSNPTDHFGRDAGIVGGAGALGAGAGYAAHERNQPQQDTTSTSVLDRGHPLSGTGDNVNPIGAPTTDSTSATRTGLQSDSGNDSHLGRDAAVVGGLGAAGAGAYGASHSGDATAHNNTSGSILDRSHPLHGSSHVNPIGAPEEGLRSGHQGHNAHSHLGAVGTSGLGHGTAADSSANTQLNRAPFDVQDATYTHISYPVGPHPTVTGNRLDPHIPGEYPTETGQDRHEVPGTSGYTEGLNTSDGTHDKSSHTGVGTGAAVGGAGLAGAGAAALSSRDNDHQATGVSSSTSGLNTGSSSYPTQSTTGTSSSGLTGTQPTTSDHHYARDGLVAGGVGAAGAGAYASTRDGHDKSLGEREDVRRADPVSSTTGSSYPTTSTTGSSYPATSTTGSTQPTTSTTSDHHYARDGLAAGGLGAAGAGAYAATRDGHDKPLGEREDVRRTDPSSTTTGSSYPTTSTTTSTTHSAPTTTSATQQPTSIADRSSEHHTGRNAALGAGAGAAGVGAYEATRDRPGESLGDRNDVPRHDPSTTTGSSTTGYGAGQSNPSGVITAPGANSSAAAEDLQHHHGKDHSAAAPIGAGAYTASPDPRLASDPAHIAAQRAAEKDASTSHTGRDAALGAGAGGTAAYAAEKAYDDDKHGHNKLHKPSPEEKKHEKEEKKLEKEEKKHDHGEKKPGLLDRILHRHHDEDHGTHHGTETAAGTAAGTSAATGTAAGTGHHFGTTEAGQRGVPLGTASEPKEHYGTAQTSGDERTIDPTTGLPMNTAKYGSGAGGTDGSSNIHGYHQETGTRTGDQSVAGPDWDAVKKNNTLY